MTKQKALSKAVTIMGDEFEYDEQSSKGAGYTVYRSTKEFYRYICDLGNRYELNASGVSINIYYE